MPKYSLSISARSCSTFASHWAILSLSPSSSLQPLSLLSRASLVMRWIETGTASRIDSNVENRCSTVWYTSSWLCVCVCARHVPGQTRTGDTGSHRIIRVPDRAHVDEIELGLMLYQAMIGVGTPDERMVVEQRAQTCEHRCQQSYDSQRASHAPLCSSAATCASRFRMLVS